MNFFLKSYDTEINQKGREYQIKKKKKSTKILTRQTLEYFTQRNDTFRSFWLKMKIYVCSLISNFINFYFDICFD